MNEHAVFIAVVGATGAFGREVLAVLDDAPISIGQIALFASPDSVGTEINFRARTHTTRILQSGCFEDIDVALVVAPPAIADHWISEAVRAGAFVVDGSGSTRVRPGIPAIVPGVNSQAVELASQNLIVSPQSIVVQAATTLQPIQQRFGLQRIVVSTYQATSDRGQRGMERLSQEILGLYRKGQASEEGEEDETLEEDSPFAHQIAFNAIPEIGDLTEGGSTTEELRFIDELRACLDLPDLDITITCVRVPWFACHAISCMVDTVQPVQLEALKADWQSLATVELFDGSSEEPYPMPFPYATREGVAIGRVRRNPRNPANLAFFSVADNVRTGVATNMINIVRELVTRTCLLRDRLSHH